MVPFSQYVYRLPKFQLISTFNGYLPSCGRVGTNPEVPRRRPEAGTRTVPGRRRARPLHRLHRQNRRDRNEKVGPVEGAGHWWELDDSVLRTRRYESNSGGEREIQRTMLKLLNQLDGFDSRGDEPHRVAWPRSDYYYHYLVKSKKKRSVLLSWFENCKDFVVPSRTKRFWWRCGLKKPITLDSRR